MCNRMKCVAMKCVAAAIVNCSVFENIVKERRKCREHRERPRQKENPRVLLLYRSLTEAATSLDHSPSIVCCVKHRTVPVLTISVLVT